MQHLDGAVCCVCGHNLPSIDDDFCDDHSIDDAVEECGDEG